MPLHLAAALDVTGAVLPDVAVELLGMPCTAVAARPADAVEGKG